LPAVEELTKMGDSLNSLVERLRGIEQHFQTSRLLTERWEKESLAWVMHVTEVLNKMDGVVRALENRAERAQEIDHALRQGWAVRLLQICVEWLFTFIYVHTRGGGLD